MRNAVVHLLWPFLMASCLALTVLGMRTGHGVLIFNLVYLCLAAALWRLEFLLPHERRWLARDGQMRADLTHTLLNKGVVQVIVVVSSVSGLAASVHGGSLKLWPEHWPEPAQIALGLVAMEFGLYWKHRLSHETRMLWPFHAVHHSAPRLWFFNTGRFHIVDTAMSLLFSLPLLFLLGAPDVVFSWVAAITAYIGILTHCNVEMKTGFLRLVFNTPELHRWHHSRDLREGNRNYGENLMIFDHLFGTYFYEDRRPPVDIGISQVMPAHFLGQIKAPFSRAMRVAS
jgi:sterol desaturase/sphingolipid hydroxylase (fatty acid hydroxylase superfamily)